VPAHQGATLPAELRFCSKELAKSNHFVVLFACTAGVAKLVDAADSKSAAFTGVPVRVRAPAKRCTIKSHINKKPSAAKQEGLFIPGNLQNLLVRSLVFCLYFGRFIFHTYRLPGILNHIPPEAPFGAYITPF
jgi:hypothetical protein